jgi:hypothetical protein
MVSAERPLATSKRGAGRGQRAGFAYPRQSKSRACKPSATTAFRPLGVVRLGGGDKDNCVHEARGTRFRDGIGMSAEFW